MNICVFDTETTNLEKPFCYNIGYIIYNTDTREILHRAEYVVEQIWHNLELFSTAYYAEKRQFYVNRMRAKKVLLRKWGYITQRMLYDFRKFNVQGAYAYNSPFDTKVFNFNCEWYKNVNPFDDIPIYDIRGYVHHFIAFTPHFKEWAEKNEAFTESGNYSTTAETLYRYLTLNNDFNEEHTALSDSEIELQILIFCIARGALLNTSYSVYQSVPRKVSKTLTIFHNDTEDSYEYTKIRINKQKTEIKLT